MFSMKELRTIFLNIWAGYLNGGRGSCFSVERLNNIIAIGIREGGLSFLRRVGCYLCYSCDGDT